MPTSTTHVADVIGSSSEETRYPKLLLNERFGQKIHENRTTTKQPDSTSIIGELLRNYRVPNASAPIGGQSFLYSHPSASSLGSIFLQQQPDVPPEAYLQPEINEVTNRFIGKIVSVAPGIKLIRPIIVTDDFHINQDATENVTASDGDSKRDQAVDSAQLHEYRDATSYEEGFVEPDDVSTPQIVSSAPDKRDENKKHSIIIADTESDGSKTIVDVEPQTVEEQAIITTTIDIAKSLPLAVNFAPDLDNHVHEAPPNAAPPFSYQPHDPPRHFGYLSPTNLIPAPQRGPLLQPAGMFLTSHPTVAAYHTPRYLPFQVASNLQPKPTTLIHPVPANVQPAPSFRYVPIPIYQHQPNIIPLNLVASHSSANVAPQAPLEFVSNNNFSQPTSTTTTSQEQTNSLSEENISKRENHGDNTNNAAPANAIRSFDSQPQKFVKSQSFLADAAHDEARRPFSIPYAITVPPAHLIPYVKQITGSPNSLQSHPFSQYLQKQPSTGVPRAYSVAYNIKPHPKDGRKGYAKSTPFKPSHPVWDSIYPPQHMYYVPYYVVDKVPSDGRKARDSSGKRNRRYVRRLYVEYGGFKPPMIPSTLLETEETGNKAQILSREASEES